MKHDQSRRTFLKTVGALAGALPFYRLLERSAVAQSATSPLRFVAIVNPHGNPYEYWRPRATGNDTPGSATETDFNLDFDTSVLAPLDKYKSRMLVLDGVSASCCLGAGHYGYQVALTGSALNTSQADQDQILPANASIDQYLANLLGSATKVRSLALGVSTQAPAYNSVLNYDPSGARIPVTIDPRQVFSTLFSNLVVGAPSAQQLAQQASQKSILDYAQGTLSSLQPKLASTEQAKLQQHLQALQDLEKQISSLSPSACTIPAAPSGPWSSLPWLDFESPGDPNDASPYYPQLIDIMGGLIAQAFACDLTRFATLRIGISGDGFPMPFIGSAWNTDTHNNIAHHFTPYSYDQYSQQLAGIQNYYAQRVSTFLDALDAIPEGDGTVLDHTIVLWMSEMGDPAGHGCSNLPIVLLGGANKIWRMGRYLQFPTVWDGSNLPPPCVEGGTVANPTGCGALTPHNQLLVSIAQAFGQNINTYGWAGAAAGPLPGLV